MGVSASRIVTITAVLLLSACAMGPDYERPEVPVPDEFAEPVLPGLSIANLRWWELFHDEDLIVLVETALANNKDALAKIRSSMRGHLVACGLCEGGRFTRTLESKYQSMWGKWCNKQPSS